MPLGQAAPSAETRSQRGTQLRTISHQPSVSEGMNASVLKGRAGESITASTTAGTQQEEAIQTGRNHFHGKSVKQVSSLMNNEKCAKLNNILLTLSDL